jgi:hypothetical protein
MKKFFLIKLITNLNLIIIKLLYILVSILLLIIINFRVINISNIIFEKYDTKYLFKIEGKLLKYKCSLMSQQQRLFLNGIVRKFKPKKVLELGVNKGGSSIIILNALNHHKNSKLYSIDISRKKYIGLCANYFPDLKPNWELFTGNIATKFIEKIGKNIDMAFIDTAHFEPGEILDFLMILPFLKKGALIGFHDIAHQIIFAGWPNSRNEWAPYIIFNIIRGKKYLTLGKKLTQGIGFIKLENNQNKYYHDYFRALGGQWQYFPNEEHICLFRKFVKKYYDNECLEIFEEAVEFNRGFIKNNPKVKFDYNLKKYHK